MADTMGEGIMKATTILAFMVWAPMTMAYTDFTASSQSMALVITVYTVIMGNTGITATMAIMAIMESTAIMEIITMGMGMRIMHIMDTTGTTATTATTMAMGMDMEVDMTRRSKANTSIKRRLEARNKTTLEQKKSLGSKALHFLNITKKYAYRKTG